MSLLLGDSKELMGLGTYSWARRAGKNDLGRMTARWRWGTRAVSDDAPLEILTLLPGAIPTSEWPNIYSEGIY